MMMSTSNSIANNHQYKTSIHSNQSIEQSFYYPYINNGIEVEYEGNQFNKGISTNDINDITNYMKNNFPVGTKLFIDENNKMIIFKPCDSTEKTYEKVYQAYYDFCVDGGLASLENNEMISRNYSIEVE